MKDLSLLIRIDKYHPPGGTGVKNVHIFKCISSNCNNEVRVKGLSTLSDRSGRCIKCSNAISHVAALEKRRIKPFEAPYNRMFDSATIRKIEFKISYEEFLEFTKIDHCHYCYKSISWKKHGGTFYNLDRKDNSVGYIAYNLVTCCGKCNKGKRELYSYEEWYGMTAYFRK